MDIGSSRVEYIEYKIIRELLFSINTEQYNNVEIIILELNIMNINYN
jgi:hypothetical protein